MTAFRHIRVLTAFTGTPRYAGAKKHEIENTRESFTSKQQTHLMSVGKIHRDKPSCAGCESKLPPGSSMHADSQTSPSTFANDVKISANTTSEKYTR